MNQVLTGYTFYPISEKDGVDIVNLFNYYIEHSDAAFPEKPVSLDFFEQLKPHLFRIPSVSVRDSEGNFIGFGMIRSHNPFEAFRHTGEVTYFIQPDHTRKGIGHQVLTYLEDECLKRGITCLLAQISSKNQASIGFHQKNGFFHCGTFARVGKKQGVFFDTIWMQKFLKKG